MYAPSHGSKSTPTRLVPLGYNCGSDGCDPVYSGTPQYTTLTDCMNACKTNNIPSQEWINSYIMQPDPTAQGAAFQGMFYNTDKEDKQNYGKLCGKTENPEPESVMVCGSICPFGMEFTKYPTDQCIDNTCKAKNLVIEGFTSGDGCIRGINAVSETSDKRPSDLNFVLTTYATSNGILQYSADALATYVSDIITNFCVPKKINMYSMYFTPPISGDPAKYQLSTDNNITWYYENFIVPCNKAGIVPGLNVYPSFKDSPWRLIAKPDASTSELVNTWPIIGEYITKLNAMVKPGQKGVEFLVFDGEECNCTAYNLPVTDYPQIRKALNTNATLPNNFKLLLSGNYSQSFGKTDTNANDFGFGEVYWNIGQSWPCKGNPSQEAYYAPVCKEGSSHRAFINKPQQYINYLIASSKAAESPLTSDIYVKSDGKQFNIPLFSVESLYTNTDQPINNGMMCSGLAYYGTSDIPNAGDKVCGTFDGFSYWDWDQFEQFLIKFAKQFGDLKYVGIYDSMFIPEKWMSGGKFNNGGYAPNLPKPWPVNCLDKKNKCKEACLSKALIKCTSDDVCNNYCYPNTGYCHIGTDAAYGVCKFNKPINCAAKNNKGDLINKCATQCINTNQGKDCTTDSKCVNNCSESAVSGLGLIGKCTGGKCSITEIDCTNNANKCLLYCINKKNPAVKCTTDSTCISFNGCSLPASYCEKGVCKFHL